MFNLRFIRTNVKGTHWHAILIPCRESFHHKSCMLSTHTNIKKEKTSSNEVLLPREACDVNWDVDVEGISSQKCLKEVIKLK